MPRITAIFAFPAGLCGLVYARTFQGRELSKQVSQTAY